MWLGVEEGGRGVGWENVAANLREEKELRRYAATCGGERKIMCSRERKRRKRDCDFGERGEEGLREKWEERGKGITCGEGEKGVMMLFIW